MSVILRLTVCLNGWINDEGFYRPFSSIPGFLRRMVGDFDDDNDEVVKRPRGWELRRIGSRPTPIKGNDKYAMKNKLQNKMQITVLPHDH